MNLTKSQSLAVTDITGVSDKSLTVQKFLSSIGATVITAITATAAANVA